MPPRVFLITGTSTGFGKHYVQAVLDAGDIAIATARNPSSLSFKNATPKNYLPLRLDVTDSKSIHAAFSEALKTFKRVDVVCNNAGYGLCAPFEEATEDQMRTQMEVNFFGLAAVTRRAMEVMRDENKPPGGVIQQVTSVGGQLGMPTFSSYNASKWAVEGFTEAVSKEVKPEWGIKFTCIEPGGFRTDWSGRSMVFPDKKHPAYDHIDAQDRMGKRHGTQVGDPVKGGQAMYKIACMEDPPLRVAIGSDAWTMIMGKVDAYRENYKKYEELAKSTDVVE
jgi:NAD(P)-dependent dehydrogenase (short-subunit alcohol dehydrogenase family)